MPVSAVIFDFGSTLIRNGGFYPEEGRRYLLSRLVPPHSLEEHDLEEFEEEAFGDMLERREFSGLDFELTQYFNLLQACLGVRFDGDLHEIACECWFRQYEPQLQDGAMDCLRMLRAKGMKVGLLSNTILSRESVRLALGRFRVLDSFDAVVCSSHVAYRKPKEPIFRAILGLLNAEAGECAMVGDSLEEDIAGAASMGMSTVWYNPEGAESPEVKPDHVVSDLRAVPEVLRLD